MPIHVRYRVVRYVGNIGFHLGTYETLIQADNKVREWVKQFPNDRLQLRVLQQHYTKNGGFNHTEHVHYEETLREYMPHDDKYIFKNH